MTVRKIVEQEELAQALEDWLVASDIPPTTPLELFFLPGEVIVRPWLSEQQDLLEWLEDASQRYDNVLRRLAAGEVEA